VLDAPPSSTGDAFSCPPGWREEKSSAGIAFVSPAGHRCLSVQEANDVARRSSLALQPLRSAVSPGSGGGGGAVISPDSASFNESSELAASHFTPVETRVRAAASQIVEVVHGVSNSEWLVELLKGMLFGADDGSKAKKEAAKRRALVLARCEALVGCCVEFLLALDDDDAAASTFVALPTSPRKAAAAAQLHENGDKAAAAAVALEAERAAKMVATLATLHVFCKASPSLLVAHMETLLPYLKGDNRIGGPIQEGKVCALVANMVSWALPLMPANRRDARLLATAASDLQQLTYRFGGDVVHAAVECLSVLAQAAPADKRFSKDAEEPLLVLARTFYRVLRPRATVWPLQPKDLAKVGRGLVVLGAICRYRTATDYDEDDIVDDNEDDDGDNEDGRVEKRSKGPKSPGSAPASLPAELTAHNLKSACYSCFLGYLRRDDEQVSRTALRGLSSQLIGSPRLMLRADRDGVVAAALAHASPVLRLEALVGWRDILQAEELRVESGLAGKQMESRLNGNGNGSSSEEEDDEDEDYGADQNGGKGVRFSADRSTAAAAAHDSGGGAIKRKVQGDQDSESSVVGGVLQLHVGTVLGLLFDKSKLGSSIRNAATSLLGVMLRQGLVNPLQVRPAH
jgi:nucleotide-binding universal stress UspA family protein